MTNMLKMVQQAASLRKEMKQIQKELEKKTVDFSASGVTVCARGDMSLVSIKLDPALVAAGGKLEELERAVLKAVNGALIEAKKEAGGAMTKLAGGGLGDLLGS